jgi:LysR family transcriptional regulator, low CO2-responsive transcriptional regulator
MVHARGGGHNAGLSGPLSRWLAAPRGRTIGGMTLTQLSAFVLVARLGSVRAAADALGVSEPAVSQALTALRQHLGEPLLVRGTAGMTLTPGGTRLLPIASQMVGLGAEATAAVRAGQGAPRQLRLVGTSTIAEFVATPLVETFTALMGGTVEASTGVAAAAEIPVLVANRLADIGLGPRPAPEQGGGLCSEPVFRCQLVAVGAPSFRPTGPAAGWPWLVDPSGTDPRSDAGRLLRLLGVPERRVRVFGTQAAAWEAAAEGLGVAAATAHLVTSPLRRGELRLVDTPATPMPSDWFVTTLAPDRRPAPASSMRQFLTTPRAMQLMRSPGAGVPPSRFRPPVYVTLWSEGP